MRLSRCSRWSSGHQNLSLSNIAVNQIVVIDATEVEVPIGFINLFTGDTDVIQSLSGGGVTEYLLEEQELAGVITAHHHLMIGKGLTQRMGRHTITEAKVFGNAFKHKVNGLLADGLVLVYSVIGLTTEHIVTEVNAGRVLKVQGHSFHNCCVDGDVAVALTLAGVSRLLLQNGETVTEGAVIIDDVGEPKHTEVTDAKSKVNTNNEQHIISEPLLSNQELRNADNIIHALDGLGGVLDSKVGMYLFSSGGDEASLELAAALLDGGDVNDR